MHYVFLLIIYLIFMKTLQVVIASLIFVLRIRFERLNKSPSSYIYNVAKPNFNVFQSDVKYMLLTTSLSCFANYPVNGDLN